MDSLHQKGTVDDKNFYDYIEKLTDRELQEKQAYYLRNLEKINTRILLNIQFWFYYILACTVIAIIIILNIKN